MITDRQWRYFVASTLKVLDAVRCISGDGTAATHHAHAPKVKHSEEAERSG